MVARFHISHVSRPNVIHRKPHTPANTHFCQSGFQGGFLLRLNLHMMHMCMYNIVYFTAHWVILIYRRWNTLFSTHRMHKTMYFTAYRVIMLRRRWNTLFCARGEGINFWYLWAFVCGFVVELHTQNNKNKPTPIFKYTSLHTTTENNFTNNTHINMLINLITHSIVLLLSSNSSTHI